MDHCRVVLMLVGLFLGCHLSLAKTIRVCNEVNVSSTCYTLQSIFTISPVLQDRDDLTVEFEGGVVYRITGNISLMYMFRNINQLALTGRNGAATIDCSNMASFAFINVTGFSINGVIFNGCGVEITQSIVDLIKNSTILPLTIHREQKIGILILNVTDLMFHEVVIQGGLGYGLVAINILGHSNITDSQFAENNKPIAEEYFKGRLDCRKKHFTICNGGNAVFIYTDFRQLNPAAKIDVTYSELNIYNTGVSIGINYAQDDEDIKYTPASSGKNLTGGGGVSLILLQTTFRVNFIYSNSVLGANEGFKGGNLHISVFSYAMNSTILIKDLTLIYGNQRFNENYITDALTSPYNSGSGGGIYYEYGNFLLADYNHTIATNLKYDITFRNIHFESNRALNGAGLYVKLHLLMSDDHRKINHCLLVESCMFIANKGFYGAGLHVNELQHVKYILTPSNGIITNEVFNIAVKDTLFVEQTAYKIHEAYEEYKTDVGAGSVIFLNSVNPLLENVTITNSTYCTSILLIDSSISCNGNINIANTYSPFANGAGVTLIGRSFFILYPNTKVAILNNTAEAFGGGVFIPIVEHYIFQPMCFFQVLSKSEVNPEINDINFYNASIEIMNNNATSGSDIFGGDLETCFLSFWDVDTKTAYKLFISAGKNTPSTPTKISSYARTLCFCGKDGIPNCNKENIYVEAFMGQQFNISMVPVGQFNGLTESKDIKAIFKSCSYHVIQVKEYQKIENKCTNMAFTVSLKSKSKSGYDESNTQFPILIAGIVEQYYWKTVHVSIQPCPSFYYANYRSNDHITKSCQCMDILKESGFNCDPNGGISKAPGYHGGGVGYIGQTDNCTYVYGYCPVEWCNPLKTTIPANVDLDYQCVNNRGGVLCGSCVNGYSNVFGSNECMKCGNTNLVMVLMFAVIGMLLVWCISFLNLTVSTGLINGIIFYANIVKVNKYILYPTLSKDNPLVILVAWLNLDFGFQLCFFNGMREFHKSVLQFMFPIYLWFLSLLIIYLSRHYRMVRKLFGKHTTPALATILLLSFNKLLNNVFKILAAVKLKYECRDGTTGSKLFWWPDATIAFNDSRHIILSAIAVATIVFCILPYLSLLLFSPCLQRLNHHKIFRWVAQIKPFLDAYQGPYNNNTQYWTGMLLLVRLGLMVAFAFNIYSYQQFQLFCIVVTSIVLLFFTIRGKGIYRLKPMNYLESLSIVNLAMFSATVQTLLNWEKSDKTVAAKCIAMISLGILGLQFIGVVVYCLGVSILRNACGINNVKELKSRMLSQCTSLIIKPNSTRQNSSMKKSSIRQSVSSYYKGYDSAQNSYDSEATTDEDLWQKPVKEYREPLLSQISCSQ